MPAFAYTGLSSGGKPIKGIETCDNVATLKSALKRKGVYLTAVTETVASAGGTAVGRSGGASGAGSITIDFSAFTDRVRPKHVASMTRLLSTLLCAGVTLPEALAALTDQVESKRFKGILGDVATKVNEGSSLADAMAVHPKIFSHMYLNMVRAGEASGSLETVLIRIAEFMDQQEELRGKITTAMFYPFAMLLVGIGVVTLLMVKVVPNIAQVFEGSDAQLPLSTRALIALSGAIAGYWWAIIAGAIVVVYLFKKWRASPVGRESGDRILLGLPVIGDLARKIAVARFARTLATMLASGVQLLSALDIVRSLLGNVVLEEVIRRARDDIREGEGIATAIRRSGQFPPLMAHMIAVGERSGQLESMLIDLASAYDRESNAAIQRATAVLEPLMIVGMGGAVAFIVFSIMTPIMQMNQMGAH